MSLLFYNTFITSCCLLNLVIQITNVTTYFIFSKLPYLDALCILLLIERITANALYNILQTRTCHKILFLTEACPLSFSPKNYAL